MDSVSLSEITFADADVALCEQLREEWGSWASGHVHIEDGFSLVAFHGARPVGLLAMEWKALPGPLPPHLEGHIDILHVLEGYRRIGIARKMVGVSLARAMGAGAVQVRAWSSDDKREAISLWDSLGFALCPVTHAM